MFMISSIFSYFFGNQNKSIEDMDRNELLDFLKEKKFSKLNISNPEYFNSLSNINIYKDDLLLFEYELYNSLLEKVGLYKGENKKNVLNKKKFYVNPKFNRETYEKNNDDINNVQDNNIKEDTISFNLAIENPNVAFNYNDISMNEFNETFRDNQSNIDMLGISKSILSDLPQLLKQVVIDKYNEILNNPLEAKHHNIGKSSLVYKISKKGSLEDTKSFRQVISIPSIVSHLHRIFALRINEHMVRNNYIDTTIQKGGISGIKLGMFEQIIKLKSIIKNANKNKNPLCLTYIDITDAFPSLNIQKLSQVLEKYHFPENLVKYIKRYYEDLTYYVSTREWNSKNIRWNRGLLQGCPMSPILFVTVLNYILKYLESKYKNDCAYEISPNNKVLFLAYMDDIAICCKNMEDSKKIFEELEKILLEFGLKINRTKTAQMIINIENPVNNPVNNPVDNPVDTGINKVTKFKYLGEWIWSNGVSQNSLRMLLYIVRSKLIWMDKSKFTNEQKVLFVTSKLMPIIQKKFAVLYDINLEEKLKVLRIVKYYTEKWGMENDNEVNILFDINDLLKDTKDEILKNIDFEDNCYQDNVNDEKVIKMKLSEIKFEYENRDEEVLMNLDLDLD